MAIATLSIDIEARLARLEEGLDRAARINQKAAQDVEARWQSVGGSVKTALAPIAAAFSVAALQQFVLENARAVDALNDVADATGSAVENISALQDVAQRTGTDVAVVETALVKLNQALNAAKPDSDVARALAAIGLSAKDLKQQDPAEALRRVAVALSGYADDGNKARLVQELFGKSLREVAPLLKDLATQTQLVGSVTKEQAEQAERFAHALGEWENASSRARQRFVGELLPTLTDIVKAFADTKGATEGVTGAAQAALVPIQALTVLGANVAFVFRGVGTEIGGMAAQLAALGRGDFQGFKAIGEEMRRDAELARKQLDDFERRVLGVDQKLQASLLGAGEAEGEVARRFRPRSLPDVGDKAKKVRDATLTAEQIAKLELEAEQQAAKDAAEAWDIWGKQRLADAQERADAETLMWKQVFEFIDQQREEDDERARTAAGVGVTKQIQQLSEFAKQAQRNIQDELAGSLEDVLAGDFSNLEKRWSDLLRRMVAQALAARLNEALFGKDGSGGFIGQGLTALLNAFGGARADGGPVMGGSAYLVGERGPEIFVPRASGTVVANGAWGPQVTINNNVAAGATRAEVLAAMQLTADSVRADVQRTLRRAGGGLSMADINWPSNIDPRGATLGVAKPGAQFAGIFNSTFQATGFNANYYTLSIQLGLAHRRMTPALAGQIEALVFYLAGGVNRVAVWHFGRPEPVGTARGTPTLSATANRGDTSLAITGATAGGTYRAGDVLGAGGYWHQLLSDVTLNGSGAGTVQLVLPVRATIASGSAVTWDRPTAYFVMPATTQAVTHVPAVMEGATLDLREA